MSFKNSRCFGSWFCSRHQVKPYNLVVWVHLKELISVFILIDEVRCLRICVSLMTHLHQKLSRKKNVYLCGISIIRTALVIDKMCLYYGHILFHLWWEHTHTILLQIIEVPKLYFRLFIAVFMTEFSISNRKCCQRLKVNISCFTELCK
jgi:hypothetical protein